MKYFLPDAQDLVDPSFDFVTERRDPLRKRQRDDVYAHQVFSERAFDGLLVSKGIVDGFGGTGSRYTPAQRQRLLREGAASFLRTSGAAWGELPIMGDCGAFTYVNEEVPPYTVEELLAFYTDCGFQYGMSLDHVILAYNPSWDENLFGETVPKGIRKRFELTLDLARAFLAARRRARAPFKPIGVAQGWSPTSYAKAVRDLQKMGYRYIALGGMVPLKSPAILQCLEAVASVKRDDTGFHLLGVTRTEKLAEFRRFGVISFDSTSPLRQAFKDATDNYYTAHRAYSAIRIPQTDGNPRLIRAISSGNVDQKRARTLERACLEAMARFDAGSVDVGYVLERLRENDALLGEKDRSGPYREVLEARPWANCACEVCKSLGYHVILFRGAERNRRRGLHNTWVFYRRVNKTAMAAPGLKLKATRVGGTKCLSS
jgi:hypothetical protein